MKENRRIKKNLEGGKEDFWWLRSTYSVYYDVAAIVFDDGDMNNNLCINSTGVSPFFII